VTIVLASDDSFSCGLARLSFPTIMILDWQNPPAGKLIASGSWRALFQPSTENFEVWEVGDGWILRGKVSGATREKCPFEASYNIRCDQRWVTKSVQCKTNLKGQQTTKLLLSNYGRWLSDGKELENVRGAIDVDLAFSPITNVLPIRRLGVAVGGSGSVTAAWVRFPELDVEPLEQSYSRISEDKYLYESKTGFRGEIDVDEYGLPINYQGGWERISPSLK
jgi:hypothetical protein